MIDRAERMGTEPLRPLVARFALPVILSMVTGSLYNLADRVFVGRGVGQEALAGVTVAFPFFILLYSIGLFFGIGGAAVVSLSLGRSDRSLAERALGSALSACVVVSVVLIGLGYVFMDPLLRAFGGQGAVLLQARAFSRIFFAGSFFQILAILLGSTIRGEGDPRTAMAASLTGIGINLVLNPVFIFGFRWGIEGSALATTIGEAVTCAWLIAHYASSRSLLRVRRSALRPDPAVLRRIAAIGFAPFLSQVALCLVMAVSNRTVVAYGGTAGVAVMGIIYVVYPLVLQPLHGIAAGAQPLLGYNYGAGLRVRVRQTLRISATAATAVCVAAWVAILALTPALVSLFQPDTATVALGTRALRVFFLLLPLVGIQVVGCGYFQAVGRAGVSLFNSLLRQVIVIVPLVLLLPRAVGLDGAWFANPVSDLVAAIAIGGFLVMELRSLRRGEVSDAVPREEGSQAF